MGKRERTPTKLFNKSDSFSRLLYNDVELHVTPTSNPTLTLLGLFIFTTAWWNRSFITLPVLFLSFIFVACPFSMYSLIASWYCL